MVVCQHDTVNMLSCCHENTSPVTKHITRLLHVLVNDALDGPCIRGELDRRLQLLKDIASRRAAFVAEVCMCVLVTWVV